MASGFHVGGADLDDIFQSGNSGYTTGFRMPNGQDIGSRYSAYFTGAHAGDTGYRIYDGRDLKDLFQKLGESPVLARANPINVSATATMYNQAITTPPITASATGGTGTYPIVSWYRVSGDNININSVSSFQTTFGMGSGAIAIATTYNATFRCTITDNAGLSGMSNDVTVTIQGPPALSAVASPEDVFGSTNTVGGEAVSSAMRCDAAGGSQSGYTYSWYQIGGYPMTITSPNSPSTTVSKRLPLNADYEGTFTCRVQDSIGGVAISNSVTAELLGRQSP